MSSHSGCADQMQKTLLRSRGAIRSMSWVHSFRVLRCLLTDYEAECWADRKGCMILSIMASANGGDAPSQLLIPAINAQLWAKNESAGIGPVLDELKVVKLLILGTFDQQPLIHDQKLKSHILLQDLSQSFREEGVGEMMMWVGKCQFSWTYTPEGVWSTYAYVLDVCSAQCWLYSVFF